MTNNQTPLLTVRNLRTYFKTGEGLVKAVDGVNFRIDRQTTFALVGESGCGKSVTAYSILQLLSMPPAFITSQRYFAGKGVTPGPDGMYELEGRLVAPAVIDFESMNLLDLDERGMRHVRGEKISMIFQEPMSSLNPVYTCGNQIDEAILLHRGVGSGEARRMTIDLLTQVGIPAPEQRYKEYPHQLSGGMRQRVMIAMALSCSPKLLIADEPTTALDVTIQAQILELLRNVQAQEGLSIMLITHDLAVVAESADVVGVMYASKMAELTDVKTLFAKPLHPYTHGLFRSLPRMGEKKHRLDTIVGNVPNPLHFPGGCKFHPRCMHSRQLAAQASSAETTVVTCEGKPVPVLKRCATQEPTLREVEKGHWCACWECPGYADAPETNPADI